MRLAAREASVFVTGSGGVSELCELALELLRRRWVRLCRNGA